MARKKRNKRINKKLILKRYQQGGNLDLLQGLGGLGSSALDIIDPADEYGIRSDVGATGSGVLKGAGAGAAAGPIGAVVGGVAGGVAGLLGNKKAKEEAQKAQEATARLRKDLVKQQSANILANYDNKGTGLNTFFIGGKIGPEKYTNITPSPTKKIRNANTNGPYYITEDSVIDKSQFNTLFQDGGQFIPLSNTAVQVKADNPNLTDSVDAGFGLVDHNEVIDKKDKRVYSDSLKTADNKRTIAEEAKRLEKMKGTGKRYEKSNQRIDNKLDELFQYQQSINGNSQGEISSGSKFTEGLGSRSGIHMMAPLRDDRKKSNQLGSDFSGTAKPYLSIDEQEMAKNKFFQANLYDDRKKEKKGTFTTLKFQKGGDPGKDPVLTPTRQFVNQISADVPESAIFRDILDDIPNPLNQQETLTFGQLSDKFKDPKFKQQFTSDHRLRKLMKQSGQTSPDDFLTGAFEAARTRFFDKAASPENRLKNIISPELQEKFGGIQSQAAQEQLMEELPFGQQNVALEKRGHESMLGAEQAKKEFAEKYPGGPLVPGKFQAGGGFGVGQSLSGSIEKPQTLAQGSAGFDSLPGTSQSEQTQQGFGESLADVAATFAPNIANIVTAGNLPQVPAPALEKSVRFQRVSPADQIAGIKQAVRGGAQDISRNTAQSATAGAAKANLIAQGIQKQNQVFGNTQRLNAQIANQEAALNTQIGGRNVGRTNQFLGEQVQRKLGRQRLISENLANATEKFLQLKRQKNLRRKDKAMLDILKKQFGESGVFDRNFQSIIDNLNKR